VTKTSEPRLRPISSLFVPSAQVVPGASLVQASSTDVDSTSQTEPIIIRTAEQQWAYAAIYDRTAPCETADCGPTVVRILAEVTTGVVGLGCLNTSQSEFLHEEFVPSSPRPVTVELVLGDAGASGPLVVRNASPNGASDARILDICCFALDPASDNYREPPLS